jgi:hypothetical protein
MGNQAPQQVDALVPLAAVAAGADLETVVFVAPWPATLIAANYIPDTTLTGADTDSRTLSVINKGGDGNGTTEMAAKAFTAGVNAPDFDETALTLDSTVEDRDVAQGDVVAFKSLHVGSTGLADPGGAVRLRFERKDG